MASCLHGYKYFCVHLLGQLKWHCNVPWHGAAGHPRTFIWPITVANAQSGWSCSKCCPCRQTLRLGFWPAQAWELPLKSPIGDLPLTHSGPLFSLFQPFCCLIFLFPIPREERGSQASLCTLCLIQLRDSSTGVGTPALFRWSHRGGSDWLLPVKGDYSNREPNCLAEFILILFSHYSLLLTLFSPTSFLWFPLFLFPFSCFFIWVQVIPKGAVFYLPLIPWVQKSQGKGK